MVGFSQSVLLTGSGDPSFPVTNKYNESYDIYSNLIYIHDASVFNIALNKSNYYLMGNFTNLSFNQGSALVLDTTTHSIISGRKWTINGLVNTAVPDGVGGFYIGGNFTRIGDSSRRYLAHIDQSGAPLNWPIAVDGIVNALFRKNDTLFIGGAFQQCNNTGKRSFAMYSLGGDSLFHTGGMNFLFMRQINALLVQKDTLIFGGNAGIIKYNFKDNVFLPWTCQVPYISANALQFNNDSSVIVCDAYYNGESILGLSNQTGGQLYSIVPSSNGALQLKVIGNKAYVAGHFDRPGGFVRKGFFSFNASTGQISNDNLNLNGYLSYMDVQGDKLYISGKFTLVNGIQRENFAALDANTLAVQNWQLSPTDPLTALSFSGPNVFVTGYFNGINSIHRDGFAAIDSATNGILPWNPVNNIFKEGKRMIARGDSLFVLGITSRPSTCFVGDYNATFKIYSLSSGAELYSQPGVDDFAIDSSYLYMSAGHQLARYLLPGMVIDPSWGTNWNGAGGDHTPTWLIVSKDKIYGVGDNRFVNPCTNLVQRTGYFVAYDKNTGHIANVWPYTGNSPYYDQVTFEHALLSGNKLYIQGYFNALNQQPRSNFVCLDITSGAINGWHPVLPNPAIQNISLNPSSGLTLFNGNIWVGCTGIRRLSDNSGFGGLAVMDTTSGNLLSPSFIRLTQDRDGVTSSYLKLRGASDFLVDAGKLIVAGGFDSVNEVPHTSLARYSYSYSSASISLCENGQSSVTTDLIGTSYQWQVNNGNGFSDIADDANYSGTGTTTLTLNHIPLAWNGFHLRCLSNGQSGKVFDFSVTPELYPSVTISPSVTEICQGSQVTFTATPVNGGNNPSYEWQVNQVGQGVTGNTFTSSALSSHDSVSVVITSNAACILQLKDTSAPVAIKVDSINALSVNITSPAGQLCQGDPITFTANALNAGASPVYRWKRNGVVAFVGGKTYTASDLTNGDSVSLALTGSADCALPASVNSNVVGVALTSKSTPSIVIQGDTVLKKGDSTLLTATSTHGGSAPVFQWQESTGNTGWKNIPAATGISLKYSPQQTGTSVRCLLTSNETCVSRSSATSNTLTITVQTLTALNDTSIDLTRPRCYPSPATSVLVVDNLLRTEGWEQLIVLGTDGRESMPATRVNGRTNIRLDIATLPQGMYSVLLQKRNGSTVCLKFLKL